MGFAGPTDDNNNNGTGVLWGLLLLRPEGCMVHMLVCDIFGDAKDGVFAFGYMYFMRK